MSGALAAAAAGPWWLGAAFGLASAIWLLSLRARPSAVVVLLVATAIRVPFAFALAPSDDVNRYVWEGRVVAAGRSPYRHAPDDEILAPHRDEVHAGINQPHLPTIYPPGAQLFFAAAAGLGLGPLGLRNLVLLLDLVLVLVLLGWLRAMGRPAGWAAIHAWCPLAVLAAAEGHYDPLMLVFLAAAGWAWETGRGRLAAGCLALAVLAKLVFVLLVPWFLLRRPRSLLLVFVPLVVLAYVPWLADDPLATLRTFGAEFAFNGSVHRLVEGLGPTPSRLVLGGLLAAWTVLVALVQPRFAHAAVLVVAGLLVLSPTVHAWYLTWFLVPLAAVGPRRWTWPLLLWCVTIGLVLPTYAAARGGGPFAEDSLRTAIEYALPAALALFLIVRAWPRREPLAPARDELASVPFAVVVPCRSEAANLRTLLPRWLETPARCVVLADTPTGDGTEALARSAPRVRYLPVPRRGYGAAVKAGLEAVGDADVAVVCDADHDKGPEQVGALLAPLRDADVGLVCAARTPARRLSLLQRFGNRLACVLIALGWGRRFHELGPYRALRLARWPSGSLTDDSYGVNVEMNVRALERGIGVVEVPLAPSRREHGRNRISGTIRGVVAAGWSMLRTLYDLRESSCRRPS